MRLFSLAAVLLALGTSGCAGIGSASSPRPTDTPTATTRTPSTVRPAATPIHPKPTPTAVISRSYAAFLRTICRAFAARDAGTIINSLPYYQYDSGLRYGNLGDGEGQTADPGLMRTWLARRARCAFFTPDIAGHGTLLTRGWRVNGMRWSLLDLDSFQGHWKINDFTFGQQSSLWWAMQSSQPILGYRG